MNEESDPERLAALEERLNTLTGNARNTLAALGKSDKGKAAALAESGDEIDRQIRDILRKFDADTYAVPPIFKERLKFHIDELTKAPNLKFVYRRKQRYWGMISREVQRARPSRGDGVRGMGGDAVRSQSEEQCGGGRHVADDADHCPQLRPARRRESGRAVRRRPRDEGGGAASRQSARRIRQRFLHAGDGFLQPRRDRSPPRPAPDRAGAGWLSQGEARLLAPVPDEEAAGGDPRVRAQGAGGGHRLAAGKEARARGS